MLGEGTNTGWFGRSIGDFGSQVGQGFDLNLGWKERLQQMALANARQKLADLMGPLQLNELQQRIKQMQAPQYEGTVNTPGGGVGAISRNPNTGAIGMNPLVPSYITPDAVGRQILTGRQSLSPNDQPYADQLLGALRMGIDPSKVMEEWQRFFAGASKAQKQKPPVVDVNKGTVAIYDSFGNGSEYPIYDAKGNINPNLPPEVKPLVASQVSAQNTLDQRKANDEERRNQEILGRLQKTEDFRAGQTATADKRSDATKAVTEAINAFSKYQVASTGQQKVAVGSHWFEPWTWGRTDLFQSGVDEAKADAEGKRIDAIQKLKDAGMPVPDWLTRPIDQQIEAVPPPNVPPPPGFVPNRPS
jgi:hypothetical protein